MLGLVLIMASALVTPGQPAPFNPADYTPAGPARIITWQTKRLPPPGGLYVSPDDNLVVSAASSQTNEVVTVNYRLLRAADGVVVPGQFTIAPASDRSLKTQTQHLCEGFLLSCSCSAAVATTRGQTFARVFLGAGAFGASQPSYMLMADYVTTAMAPAHPNGRQLAPAEGPGWLRQIAVGNIAFGVDWTQTIPNNAVWRLISVWTALSTSALGGARAVSLNVTGPSGNSLNLEPSATVAPAGFADINALSCYHVPTPAGGDVFFPLPVDFKMFSQAAIRTNTAGLLIGDKFSAPVLTVEEWLDNV